MYLATPNTWHRACLQGLRIPLKNHPSKDTLKQLGGCRVWKNKKHLSPLSLWVYPHGPFGTQVAEIQKMRFLFDVHSIPPIQPSPIHGCRVTAPLKIPSYHTKAEVRFPLVPITSTSQEVPIHTPVRWGGGGVWRTCPFLFGGVVLGNQVKGQEGATISQQEAKLRGETKGTDNTSQNFPVLSRGGEMQ